MLDVEILEFLPQIVAGGGVAGGFLWVTRLLKRAEKRAEEEPFMEPEIVVNELWAKEWQYWNQWLIAVIDQKASGNEVARLKKLLQFMYATRQPLQEGYEQPAGVSDGMHLSYVFIPYSRTEKSRWVLAGSDSGHPDVRNLGALLSSVSSLPGEAADFRRQVGTLTRLYAEHLLNQYRPSPSTIRVWTDGEWENAVSRQRMLNFEIRALLDRIEEWLDKNPHQGRSHLYAGDIEEGLKMIDKARKSRVEPAELRNADLVKVSDQVTVPSSLSSVLSAEEHEVVLQVQVEFQGMSRSEQHDSESLMRRLMEAVKAAGTVDDFDEERRDLARRLAAENRRLAVAGLRNLLDRVRVSQQEARLRTLRTENLYLTETVKEKAGTDL